MHGNRQAFWLVLRQLGITVGSAPVAVISGNLKELILRVVLVHFLMTHRVSFCPFGILLLLRRESLLQAAADLTYF